MTVGFRLLALVLVIAFGGPAYSASCFSNVDEILSDANLLLRQNQNLLASYQFHLAKTLACKNEDKAEGAYGFARSLFRLNENVLAESVLNEVETLSPTSLLGKKSKFLKAWYQPDSIEILSSADQQKLQDYRQRVAEYRDSHWLKRPWLAGTLSAVLPGAGQIYNGNLQSASMSFVINSLFLATALELNRKGLQTSSLAAGLIFSVTYIGNIMGSIRSAQQINRSYQDPKVQEIRQEMLPEIEL